MQDMNALHVYRPTLIRIIITIYYYSGPDGSHFPLFETSAVASFTKEGNPRLAKRTLKTNGRLANRGLTPLESLLLTWINSNPSMD